MSNKYDNAYSLIQKNDNFIAHKFVILDFTG